MNIKILFISFEYPPYPGGIGEYTHQISSRLNHVSNYESIVLTAKSFKSNHEIEQFAKYHTHRIIRFKDMPFRRIKPLYYFLCVVYRLIKTIKTYILYQPTLILACDQPSSYLAFALYMIFKTRYIIVGHGSEFLKFSKPYAVTLRHAEKIILNSRLTKAYLDKHFQRNIDKAIVIDLGADETIYRSEEICLQEKIEALKQRFSIADEMIILLTVGTVSHRKGQDFILRALAQLLNQKNFNIIYIAAGRIRDKKISREAGELGIDHRVIFTDFVDRDVLPALYKLSDIYIQPSRVSNEINELEGFSISTCEALMMDNSVVVTTDTGIQDLIQDLDIGFVIEPDCDQELINVLTYLINQPEKRKQLAERGKIMALEHLTWEKTAEKTLLEIEKVCQSVL